MKKLSLLLSLIMLFLCACGNEAENESKVSFYYPLKEISYGGSNSVIRAESHDLSHLSHEQLLASYLNGPTQPELSNPFPNGVKIVSLKQKDAHITLVLTDRFASLSGLKLTMACVCLGKTAMQLTGTNSITISCETQLLNGDQTIYLTLDSVLFEDTGTELPIPASTTQE